MYIKFSVLHLTLELRIAIQEVQKRVQLYYLF